MDISTLLSTYLTLCTLVIPAAQASKPASKIEKPGTCPPAPKCTRFLLLCRSDADCEGSMKCCKTYGGDDCREPVEKLSKKDKPGTCPPVRGTESWFDYCRNDADCPRALKCCPYNSGHDCVEPELPIIEKPGTCPREKADGPGPFAQWCGIDSHCEGSMKCCLTRRGFRCAVPEEEQSKQEKPGSWFLPHRFKQPKDMIPQER
uniref:WAP four-disulfide core domain protein 5 n=1 Tax=Trichuris muris TaxID=70415 RepID=A0A5S6QNV5_TRIMR